MKKLVSIPVTQPTNALFSAHSSAFVPGGLPKTDLHLFPPSESHEVREGPQHIQQAAGHRGHRPYAGLHSVHEVCQEGGGHQIRPLHLQKGQGGPPHAPPRLRVGSTDGILLQQGACTPSPHHTGIQSSQLIPLCLPRRINPWPLRSLNWV